MMGLTAFRWPFRLFSLLVLSSLLAFNPPSSDARIFWHYPARPAASDISHQQALADSILRSVNRFRAQYNLPPVRLDPRLNQAAQSHANDMATRNELTHLGRDGSNPGQRVENVGYHWTVIAENVAAGQTSADEVVSDWINSPGHRANLLKTSITDIGVGHQENFWTLTMAAQQQASR